MYRKRIKKQFAFKNLDLIYSTVSVKTFFTAFAIYSTVTKPSLNVVNYTPNVRYYSRFGSQEMPSRSWENFIEACHACSFK